MTSRTLFPKGVPRAVTMVLVAPGTVISNSGKPPKGVEVTDSTVAFLADRMYCTPYTYHRYASQGKGYIQ